MNKKACCITGNRDIPTEKRNMIENILRGEILDAIENGCTHFISGFASGVDLLFAQAVVYLKAQYAITLEAAIPYPGRMKTPDKLFQSLIRCCDVVKIHSEKYTLDCYRKRNRYMVEQSFLVIGVHDGRTTGGTVATLKYAEQLGKRILRTYWPQLGE